MGLLEGVLCGMCCVLKHRGLIRILGSSGDSQRFVEILMLIVAVAT